MKESYVYKDEDLLRVPYINIFLRDYNTSYKNSFGLEQKMTKEKNLVDLHKKEIVIFYDPAEINEATIAAQIKAVKIKILSNLKQLMETSLVDPATTQELEAHLNSSRNTTPAIDS